MVDEFWNWFDKNMIYCEDTHSFVHRLYDEFKDSNYVMGYRHAQQVAWRVIAEMKKEYDDTPKLM